LRWDRDPHGDHIVYLIHKTDLLKSGDYGIAMALEGKWGTIVGGKFPDEDGNIDAKPPMGDLYSKGGDPLSQEEVEDIKSLSRKRIPHDEIKDIFELIRGSGDWKKSVVVADMELPANSHWRPTPPDGYHPITDLHGNVFDVTFAEHFIVGLNQTWQGLDQAKFTDLGFIKKLRYDIIRHPGGSQAVSELEGDP